MTTNRYACQVCRKSYRMAFDAIWHAEQIHHDHHHETIIVTEES